MRLELVLTILLFALPAAVGSQTASGRPPDECFGFSFGPWKPPLKTVASASTPGTDPVHGKSVATPADAPRESAAWLIGGAPSKEPARDSVLVLFPSWWPAGVTIEWRETRGDTLFGIARALVADGRIPNPVSTVQATRLPCDRPRPTARP